MAWRRARRGGWLAICVTALLAWPAGAPAEPIATLGHGANPSAVVDAAGTLHAVWDATGIGDSGDHTMYCQLPAGATSCQPVALPDLPVGSPPAYQASILRRPADGALFVVAYVAPTLNQLWLYASSDGGGSWSAPIEIASGVVDVMDVQLSSDGSAIELLGLNSVWQSAPLSGPPETRTVNLGHGTMFEAADGGLTHLPDGRNIVVSGSVGLLHFGWRVLGAGDPFQEASWSPWEASLIGTSVDADTGPSGTWVAREAGRVSVLRWDGHTFASVGGQLGTTANRPIAIDVDLGGRVHVAWWPSTATCPRSCIAYRRRDARGFGPAIFYPIPFTASVLLPLVVAANEHGSGWIVWQDHGQAGNLRAVPLVSAPASSRTGSRAIGHRRIAIPVRRGCIRRGTRFAHRLLVSGRDAGVQILSVRFSFDANQLTRVDRTAPYGVTYRLSFPFLSRHVAVARVTYRSAGHTHTTTVGRMIVMCAA